jgi:hypothetical protein
MTWLAGLGLVFLGRSGCVTAELQYTVPIQFLYICNVNASHRLMVEA